MGGIARLGDDVEKPGARDDAARMLVDDLAKAILVEHHRQQLVRERRVACGVVAGDDAGRVGTQRALIGGGLEEIDQPPRQPRLVRRRGPRGVGALLDVERIGGEDWRHPPVKLGKPELPSGKTSQLNTELVEREHDGRVKGAPESPTPTPGATPVSHAVRR
jgi:hypothetical protein